MSKEMNYMDLVVTSSSVDPIEYEDSEFFRVWNNLQFMPCKRCQENWSVKISDDEGTDKEIDLHSYEGWDLCVSCNHNLRVIWELRRGGPSSDFKNRR